MRCSVERLSIDMRVRQVPFPGQHFRFTPFEVSGGVFPDEPGSSSTLGVSAAKAASDKHQKHTYAVEHAGHKFSALAMETFGHMDSAVDRFVTDVAAHVPSWDRREARKQALIDISSAIVRGSARIVRSRVDQMRWVNRYAHSVP